MIPFLLTAALLIFTAGFVLGWIVVHNAPVMPDNYDSEDRTR